MPRDITVTKIGHLVYTDYMDNTVNIMKGKEIQRLIRLHQWKPVSVCCTPSSDLLLIMDGVDKKQTKIMRYSEYVESQSIQFNEKVSLSIHLVVILNSSPKTEVLIYVYQIVQLIQLWLSINLDLCDLFILTLLQQNNCLPRTASLQTPRVGS